MNQHAEIIFILMPTSIVGDAVASADYVMDLQIMIVPVAIQLLNFVS